MKIINWNVEWNTGSKSKSLIINEIIRSFDPDLVCLTESNNDFNLDKCSNVITSDYDYGYNVEKVKRKVILNSCRPFYDINKYGCIADPGGRFVSGMTSIDSVEYFLVGICIPWADSHVNSGHKNRERWQDHRLYLENLKTIIKKIEKQKNVIVLGDFNQRIPRKGQPEDVYLQLLDIFDGYSNGANVNDRIVSDSAIDHVFVGKDLKINNITVIQKEQNGITLSDHDGYFVEIENAV